MIFDFEKKKKKMMMMKRPAIFLILFVVATSLSCVCYGERILTPDSPITGSEIMWLDGNNWELSSETAKMTIKNVKVPGDLMTDLQNANIIGDPIYMMNFKNASIWDDHVWTYSINVPMANHSDSASASYYLLTFEGVKMGAQVRWNNELKGEIKDQFLRYEFQLSPSDFRADGNNVLTVSFDPSMGVDGRFSAFLGGWDWNFYTNTREAHNASLARTFSKGIWKSVYLVRVDDVAITHMVPHVFYRGEYPVEPLVEREHGGFDLRLRLFFHAAVDTKAHLTVLGSWKQDNSAVAAVNIEIPAANHNSDHNSNYGGDDGDDDDSKYEITLGVDAKDIDLWWPVGFPSRKLYEITAVLETERGTKLVVKRTVGFRFVALVTGNDTDADYRKKGASLEGSDSQGMFFRVNGAAVYARGANMIPMDNMDGRLSDLGHALMVENAAAAGMNMLRIWGGGMFLPRAFYETCDEIGMLVYHDMQFAQEGHAPAVSPTQHAEFLHQMRRLSHHASIVIWDGCNECQVVLGTDTGIYATFVMTVVAQEDDSRIVWPSCPAGGWKGGVHRLTGLPNGKALLPQSLQSPIETHGPYQHGTGFPSVNGGDKIEDFDPRLPIPIQKTETGLQLKNVFASEFGSSVMSSFESMSATLDAESWGLHGGQPEDVCQGGFDRTCVGSNPMAERNYPCDNILDVYFGLDESINMTGETVFRKQLYQCMLGQALLLKSDIETRRSTNEIGTLIWQLGEVYPCGGWGSLEYGSEDVKGQIVGGRWKPLHYFLRNSLFTDVSCACGANNLCYLKNDSPFAHHSVVVNITSINLMTAQETEVISQTVDLAAGPAVTTWFNIPDDAVIDRTTHVLHIVVSSGASVLSDNIQLFDVPKNLVYPKDVDVSVTVHEPSSSDENEIIKVWVGTNTTAMYVYLSTLAQGQFSDNAMVVLPPGKLVHFHPLKNFNWQELKDTIKVQHLAK